jgi:hypothetical protein
MAKNPLISLPLARKLIAGSLPPRATGRVQLRTFDGYTVVELITNAWRHLPLTDKIMRVRKALDSGLTEAQKNSILRVAVLTPREESAFLEAHPRVAKSRQRRGLGATGVSSGKSAVLKSARQKSRS